MEVAAGPSQRSALLRIVFFRQVASYHARRDADLYADATANANEDPDHDRDSHFDPDDDANVDRHGNRDTDS
jgi:hypothetical protein